MKRSTIVTILLTSMTTISAISCTDTKIAKPENNILVEKWDTPHGVPPFEKIRIEDYKPAITYLIDQGREQINAIASNPAAPTFENTIEALELQGADLDRVLEVFFNLNSAATNDSMQALALELSPMLSEYSNDITLNDDLFARVKSVYDSLSGDSSLTPERRMLLETSYKGFVRSGANLSPADKDKYRALSSELSALSLQFDQNLLEATNAFTLDITDSADLVGLPDAVREAAAAEASEAGEAGWRFTLHAPSYVPFMMYSERRDLRKKMYLAYNSRAFGDSTDNQQAVLKTANLRLEMANLLGYKTYADYSLEERMARNAQNVNNLLSELLDKSKAHAAGEVATIEKYAAQHGLTDTLMPWDWAMYSEKYKSEKYDLSDEMTRPYFRLDSVSRAVFMLAERLYGLSFVENTDIPVYHPDVHPYEVYDAPREGQSRGDLLAILYIDYFPRASKRGGAWMTSYRSAEVTPTGEKVIPIVSLVCNFTKPTPERPSLLSFDEVTTLLHEFGHGLHGMIGTGRYSSLTGTSVYRDFVELPSQIMENWATEPEYLDLWARHYQTGEKMPRELIRKIEDAKRYLAAYSNVRQLQFGITDMTWHSISEPVTVSVAEFERGATQRTQLLPVVDGTCFSTSFGHIFSGGYAAGYYSYKWAEVLEADAYAQFKKNGIFDRTTADSFRRNILTPGGSQHPMELYVAFSGSEPTVEPLLEKMGITDVSMSTKKSK